MKSTSRQVFKHRKLTISKLQYSEIVMTAVRIIRENRRYREREKQNVQIETEKKIMQKKRKTRNTTVKHKKAEKQTQ